MISMGPPVEQLPSGNMISSHGIPPAVVHLISASTLQTAVVGTCVGISEGSGDGTGDGGLDGSCDGTVEGGLDGLSVGGLEGGPDGWGEGGLEGALDGVGEGGGVGLCVGGGVGLCVGGTLLTSLGRKRCQKAASSSKIAGTFPWVLSLRDALPSAFSKARAVRRRNVFALSSLLASIPVAANTKTAPAARRIFILNFPLSSSTETGYFVKTLLLFTNDKGLFL
jgi:hypothetical protein